MKNMIYGAALVCCAMSLLLLIAMGADKRLAKTGGRRVPERRLFLLALLGGFGNCARIVEHIARDDLIDDHNGHDRKADNPENLQNFVKDLLYGIKNFHECLHSKRYGPQYAVGRILLNASGIVQIFSLMRPRGGRGSGRTCPW